MSGKGEQSRRKVVEFRRRKEKEEKEFEYFYGFDGSFIRALIFYTFLFSILFGLCRLVTDFSVDTLVRLTLGVIAYIPLNYLLSTDFRLRWIW